MKLRLRTRRTVPTVTAQPCTRPVAVTHPCGFHGCDRDATDTFRGVGVCRGHLFIAMERAS